MNNTSQDHTVLTEIKKNQYNMGLITSCTFNLVDLHLTESNMESPLNTSIQIKVYVPKSKLQHDFDRNGTFQNFYFLSYIMFLIQTPLENTFKIRTFVAFGIFPHHVDPHRYFPIKSYFHPYR